MSEWEGVIQRPSDGFYIDSSGKTFGSYDRHINLHWIWINS